jgi:hypothetical protein
MTTQANDASDRMGWMEKRVRSREYNPQSQIVTCFGIPELPPFASARAEGGPCKRDAWLYTVCNDGNAGFRS